MIEQTNRDNRDENVVRYLRPNPNPRLRAPKQRRIRYPCPSCKKDRSLTDRMRRHIVAGTSTPYCRLCRVRVTASRNNKPFRVFIYDMLNPLRDRFNSYLLRKARVWMIRYGVIFRGPDDLAYWIMRVHNAKRCEDLECQRKPTKKNPLVLHHNHDTGEPVSVLCSMCNLAYGLTRDKRYVRR